MNRLALRQVTARQAQATRALGAGVSAAFHARGLAGELCLVPLSAQAAAAPGTWFDSAIGPLHLSDAGAVLSLLGELPVSVAGAPQAWYWQALSQQLSPLIAESLSPLSMRESAPQAEAQLRCTLRVRLGEEIVHAQLATSAETLLDWLQAPLWQPRRRPFPATLELHEPLIVGLCELSGEQLATLRPGDVVIPSEARFDCDGHGVVTLAERRWIAQTQACGARLLLNLEADSHDQ
ncbi:type III secretion protein Q [Pseudomonas flavescens]|uniref:Type III secretion protein Q n=1 Tax=Phytopseudomonas flavescens TaxID=29435 RepID=A0A1G8DKE9_9GAMM|nr:hypothetical protein [Pseudomonas flavescens]SDH58098.1 type III secretion protein Q [Pseudomonas flavescens]